MSDQKYFNTYIDTAVGTVHEYINVIIKLKTELKLVTDLISEKDAEIASLRGDIERTQQNNQSIDEANQNARLWEDQFNAMKNKASHLDTLSGQFNDVKNRLIKKTQEFDEVSEKYNNLLAEVKELRKYAPKSVKETAKKVINSKNAEPPKKEEVSKIVNTPVVIPEEKNDDF